MKRVIVCLLVLLVLTTCAVAETKVDVTSMTLKDLYALRQSVEAEIKSRHVEGEYNTYGTLGNCSIAIVGDARGARDINGNICMVFSFVWSHENKEADNFYHMFEVEAFQDGVGLVESYSADGLDSDDKWRAIKPGVIATQEIGFELLNMSSPIELEIRENAYDAEGVLTTTFYFKEK